MKKLEPGRELDERIAEEIMGWRREGNSLIPPGGEGWTRDESGRIQVWLPRFSTNPNDAWQVVEYMRKEHRLYFTLDAPGYPGATITAVFRFFYDDGRELEEWAAADKLAHAICLAALDAKAALQ